MDKYYIICETCGNKAYGIPGEAKLYWCPHCEMKFHSDKNPKVEKDNWLDDRPPGQEEEGEMPKLKERACPECGTKNEWVPKKKCYVCGKCGKEYRAPRKNKEKKAKRNKGDLPIGVTDKGKIVMAKDIKAGWGQCESCIHKDVCGLTPQCKHYVAE